MGKHRIQGISDEFIPPVLDLAILDRVVDVDDGDAILMAQKLATYLSTGLLRDEPLKPDFLAPDVTLVSMRAFKRVCHTCCDPVECALEGGPHPINEALPVCVRRAV